MRALVVVLSIWFVCACQRGSSLPENRAVHFQGVAMTMPYHVVVAQKLSIDEKKDVTNLIDQTFREIDQTFNNWNPSSEISRLNNALSIAYYSISAPLAQILAFCDGIVQLSGNRFDPTIEPIERLWQEAFKTSVFPSSEKQKAAADAVGWQHISWQKGLFRKDHPMTRVDLCAVAKGLCVDWITERLQAKGYANLYIEWAGKIRVSGHDPSGSDWQVCVDPALRMEGRPIAPIKLSNAAIATTADCLQKTWHLKTSDGQEHYYLHIIDPLQSQPLEKTDYSIASATVIAPTCVLANALATSAMVFETRKEAQNWAQEVVELYPQVSFWIIAYDIKNRP